MIIDPAQEKTSDIYRAMIRCIVPRPIAWVSTLSADGVDNLAPFSFFTGVTSSPPSLCFCPGRRGDTGGRKDTLANVEATGEFVVNVVPESLAEKMNQTATDFPPDVSEFEAVGLTTAPSQVVAVPRVAESPVNLECELLDVINVGPDGRGGGAIVIGEIVMFHLDESVTRDGKVDAGLLNPVSRLGGLEYATLGRRFDMKRRKL